MDVLFYLKMEKAVLQGRAFKPNLLIRVGAVATEGSEERPDPLGVTLLARGKAQVSLNARFHKSLC
jgi:hypothetical protein